MNHKHKVLQIDSLTQHTAAINHASQLGGIQTESSEHMSLIMNGAIADIQYILLAHNAIVCRNSHGPDSPDLKLLAAASAFCKATLAQVALADEWCHERLEATNDYAAGRNPVTLASATERTRVVTATMIRLEGKYSDRVNTLNRELIAARSRFIELLSPYIA